MSLFEFHLPRTIARALKLPSNSPKRQQLRVLKKLLKKARYTEFGQEYLFDEILLSKHVGKKFQNIVPTHDYSKIYKKWWHRTLNGSPDVCWPGKIKPYPDPCRPDRRSPESFRLLYNLTISWRFLLTGDITMVTGCKVGRPFLGVSWKVKLQILADRGAHWRTAGSCLRVLADG